MVYVKASQGYQAPGFNYASGALNTARTFDAETLWAYESGIKSQFLDRRVTLNAAVFYYDYQDIQIRQIVATGFNEVQNAASATIKGVEASVATSITQDLAVGAQFTYLDAKYDDFCQPISGGAPIGADPLCAAGSADRSGNRLTRAPQWAGGLNLDYRRTLGSAGQFSIHVNYAWESNSYYSPVNETPMSTGGWDRIGARIGYEFMDGPEVYLYGRNIGKKIYLDSPARNTAFLAPGGISEPRTYGAGVSYRF
jgi:iron complex outermembrane receptor protein